MNHIILKELYSHFNCPKQKKHTDFYLDTKRQCLRCVVCNSVVATISDIYKYYNLSVPTPPKKIKRPQKAKKSNDTPAQRRLRGELTSEIGKLLKSDIKRTLKGLTIEELISYKRQIQEHAWRFRKMKADGCIEK